MLNTCAPTPKVTRQASTLCVDGMVDPSQFLARPCVDSINTFDGGLMAPPRFVAPAPEYATTDRGMEPDHGKLPPSA